MAAPILRQNKKYFLTILSGNFYSRARFISALRTCLAKAETSQKQSNADHGIAATSGGDVKEAINIPYKIERSRTAILEALAKTVKSGLNQPIYQSIDDPALLSRSDGLVKNHLASLDNGRIAARNMIAMNPEYYTHFWDEPLPQSFDTVVTGYKHEGPSEEALLERITRRKVSEAIEMYREIKTEGVTLSQPVLEEFLDLLTVFNHQDVEADSDLENYINPQFDNDSPFPVVTWKRGNLAEEVFQLLSDKSAKAYCSIICGMADNFDKEKAVEMYREARAANISLDLFTYNKLLSILSLDMESMDDIIKEIEFVLQDMAASDVSPDVETFNSLLQNCRRVSRWRGTKVYALSLLAEMEACGIEPSLGTWKEILNIFYYHKDKSARSPELFENMLEMIKDKSFEVKGPRDVFFFRTAMRVISNHLPDSKLALKLHDILTSHKNFDLIGHRQLRYSYFKDLFLLIVPVEPTDKVMEIYNSVVPYIFMPQLDAFKLIFENIEMFDTYHYLPQICTDLDPSNFYLEKGAVPLFRLIANKQHEAKLQDQFCDITSAFLLRWENSKLHQVGPYLDGGVIGDMIKIYIDGDRLKEAKAVLEMYKSNRKLQNADPSDRSLQVLAEALMAANDYSSTKDLLTFMHNLGCENLPQLVTKAVQTFQPSDQERNYLEGLVQESSSSSSSDSDE